MTTIDLDELTSRAHSADADGRFVAVEPGTMLALIDALKVAKEALEPFSSVGWMTSDTEHTGRTIVAHMHPESEREIILSSDDFYRAKFALAALSSLPAPD